jgi:hypothetical protein
MEALYLVGLLAVALVLSVVVLVRELRVQWVVYRLLMRMSKRRPSQ